MNHYDAILRDALTNLLPTVFIVYENGWYYREAKTITKTKEEGLAFLNMNEEKYEYQLKNYDKYKEGFWCYSIEQISTIEMLNEIYQDIKRNTIQEQAEEITKAANIRIRNEAAKITNKQYNELAKKLAKVINECGHPEFGWWEEK